MKKINSKDKIFVAGAFGMVEVQYVEVLSKMVMVIKILEVLF